MRKMSHPPSIIDIAQRAKWSATGKAKSFVMVQQVEFGPGEQYGEILRNAISLDSFAEYSFHQLLEHINDRKLAVAIEHVMLKSRWVCLKT
jgi:hypothetical protein